MDKLIEIKNVATSRGGRCLSDIYINNTSLLLFECSNEHQWKTCWKNINKGAWCPECALIKSRGKNNSRSDTIENMQKIAIGRGGRCLSLEYLGAHMKLVWQCSLGHEWHAKPNAIKNGTWCPKCSEGIGERVCRLIFETIFKNKFPKIRPDWLKSPTSNQNLELDGYCEPLGIAFEYNGEQHYSDNTIYTRSQYDLFKIQKCQSKNVKLFIIKEIKNIPSYNNIVDEIRLQAANFSLEIPDVEIPINEVYKTNVSTLFLEDLKIIAISKDGKCLSDNYIDNVVKLDFFCGKCNFVWQASPNSIKNGTWCPNCANKIKSIDDAIRLASLRGGKCLSTEYIDSVTKMSWQCGLGHVWQASYNQIQSGGWCPECFKLNRGQSKKLGIEVYNQAAINKGGICLSTEINSCYDKLEWKCSEGHTWLARADLIKNTKQWCPICNILNKKKKRNV